MDVEGKRALTVDGLLQMSNGLPGRGRGLVVPALQIFHKPTTQGMLLSSFRT